MLCGTGEAAEESVKQNIQRSVSRVLGRVLTLPLSEAGRGFILGLHLSISCKPLILPCLLRVGK